jgi:hypothetical protein
MVGRYGKSVSSGQGSDGFFRDHAGVRGHVQSCVHAYLPCAGATDLTGMWVWEVMSQSRQKRHAHSGDEAEEENARDHFALQDEGGLTCLDEKILRPIDYAMQVRLVCDKHGYHP